MHMKCTSLYYVIQHSHDTFFRKKKDVVPYIDYIASGNDACVIKGRSTCLSWHYSTNTQSRYQFLSEIPIKPRCALHFITELHKRNSYFSTLGRQPIVHSQFV